MKTERMARHSRLEHEFVEFIPDEMAEGKLYVCVGLATVVHKCCCGCGNEVVTPLSPTAWNLTFDGEAITLSPSIGNWGFRCQSHYWIKNNQVAWAEQWSLARIDAGRAQDRRIKERQHEVKRVDESSSAAEPIIERKPAEHIPWWRKWWPR